MMIWKEIIKQLEEAEKEGLEYLFSGGKLYIIDEDSVATTYIKGKYIDKEKGWEISSKKYGIGANNE